MDRFFQEETDMSLQTVLAWLILSLAVITSNSEAADLKLPGGYAIVETQPNERVITHGADVVVFGNVDRYAVSGELVIGVVTKPKPPAEEPNYYDDVRVGFFLLDTKTGMLAPGMDEASWNQLLKQLGFRKIPELKSTCPQK
jgi:hypothetical protein